MPTTDELQDQINALAARVDAIEAGLGQLQGRVPVKPYALPKTPTPALDAQREAQQKSLERQTLAAAQR